MHVQAAAGDRTSNPVCFVFSMLEALGSPLLNANISLYMDCMITKKGGNVVSSYYMVTKIINYINGMNVFTFSLNVLTFLLFIKDKAETI